MNTTYYICIICIVVVFYYLFKFEQVEKYINSFDDILDNECGKKSKIKYKDSNRYPNYVGWNKQLNANCSEQQCGKEECFVLKKQKNCNNRNIYNNEYLGYMWSYDISDKIFDEKDNVCKSKNCFDKQYCFSNSESLKCSPQIVCKDEDTFYYDYIDNQIKNGTYVDTCKIEPCFNLDTENKWKKTEYVNVVDVCGNLNWRPLNLDLNDDNEIKSEEYIKECKKEELNCSKSNDLCCNSDEYKRKSIRNPDYMCTNTIHDQVITYEPDYSDPNNPTCVPQDTCGIRKCPNQHIDCWELEGEWTDRKWNNNKFNQIYSRDEKGEWTCEYKRENTIWNDDMLLGENSKCTVWIEPPSTNSGFCKEKHGYESMDITCEYVDSSRVLKRTYELVLDETGSNCRYETEQGEILENGICTELTSSDCPEDQYLEETIANRTSMCKKCPDGYYKNSSDERGTGACSENASCNKDLETCGFNDEGISTCDYCLTPTDNIEVKQIKFLQEISNEGECVFDQRYTGDCHRCTTDTINCNKDFLQISDTNNLFISGNEYYYADCSPYYQFDVERKICKRVVECTEGNRDCYYQKDGLIKYGSFNHFLDPNTNTCKYRSTLGSFVIDGDNCQMSCPVNYVQQPNESDNGTGWCLSTYEGGAGGGALDWNIGQVSRQLRQDNSKYSQYYITNLGTYANDIKNYVSIVKIPEILSEKVYQEEQLYPLNKKKILLFEQQSWESRFGQSGSILSIELDETEIITEINNINTKLAELRNSLEYYYAVQVFLETKNPKILILFFDEILDEEIDDTMATDSFVRNVESIWTSQTYTNPLQESIKWWLTPTKLKDVNDIHCYKMHPSALKDIKDKITNATKTKTEYPHNYYENVFDDVANHDVFGIIFDFLYLNKAYMGKLEKQNLRTPSFKVRACNINQSNLRFFNEYIRTTKRLDSDNYYEGFLFYEKRGSNASISFELLDNNTDCNKVLNIGDIILVKNEKLNKIKFFDCTGEISLLRFLVCIDRENCTEISTSILQNFN